MILPFMRLKLDKNGLFNGKTPEAHRRETVGLLIKWLQENLPDTEAMKKEMSPEQLSIPEEFRPHFNGYHSCYAFIQLAYIGEPTGYYFNWREYCTDEQRKWIESWHVFDGDGQLNMVESAKKLQSTPAMNHGGALS